MGTDDELERRKSLTFAQAEGRETLPRQLKPREVSRDLRLALWDVFHCVIARICAHGVYLADEYQWYFRRKHIYFDKLPADQFNPLIESIVKDFRKVILNADYVKVLDLTQFMVREFADKKLAADVDLPTWINHVLIEQRAAYRVIDNTLIPISSEEEATAIKTAFADLESAGLAGARTHLRKAATELTSGRFEDSVRESVHTVESVARSIEPSAELSKALARLERRAKIHGALKSGFSSIYGYSSDEKGIRHPLLDDPTAHVDEIDALFMIGACASFVSYLINKARKAGLLN